jgi:acyl-CoA synthetase (AMP-forming)/AMP-acid ligase II
MTLPPLLDRISDYAAWHASAAPEAAALVLGDKVTTYAELSASVDALAKALLAAGVAKGDRVATLQSPHPEYVTAWLAAASIGAIWVGLNPRYQTPELVYVIEDAEPKVLLTRTDIGGRSYFSEIEFLRAATPTLSQVVAFADQPSSPNIISMAAFLAAGALISDATLKAARDACGGRDPCLIVYTSGSTGKPKGALLHHSPAPQYQFFTNQPYRLCV